MRVPVRQSPALQAWTALFFLLGTLVLAGCRPQVGTPVAAAVPGGPVTAAAGDPAQTPAATPAEGGAAGQPNDPQPAEEPAKEGAADQRAADQGAAQNPQPPAGAGGDEKDPLRPASPFQNRIPAPEFPKGLAWLNSKPLTKADLKGKFVLLDFWTYCCINCMHILPELKKLEHEFPNELVVIGVHSAKFDTEKDADNIRAAVLRYEIEHPVVNDAEHQIWDSYGVNSWPSILMIDPEGYAVWGRSGEFKAAEVREILKAAIIYYRDRQLLDDKQPLALAPEVAKEETTPLRFPGKILADEKGGRLFISDSNHNRLVIATLEGKLLDVIGSGAIGRADGDYQAASFNKPQGCVLHGETLYVADTENHLLRKIDLKAKKVTTISGTGEQATHSWPGLEKAQVTGMPPERWVGPPAKTALNSPWALWIHEKDLYIAMAGPHQIWKMPLDESEIGPYAGNGREDIVDGPLLPRIPYSMGYSSFAQPSGLSSDGTWLFVADSEGSSIRAVPFDPKLEVRTVVGSNELEFGRLFAFGDKDGPRTEAKLQHALEVVHVDGKLYVADTYNHKIKVVDASTGETRTLAGTGQAGTSDEPAQFHEPAGLAHAGGKLYVADTNNHLLRTLDLKTGKVAPLTIEGLAPPAAAAAAKPAAEAAPKPALVEAKPKKPSFKGAHEEKLEPVKVKPADGQVQLSVALRVPEGWKLNPDAPMSYWLEATGESGPIDRQALGRTRLKQPATNFTAHVPVTGAGQDEVVVSLSYSYCQDGPDGVCKIGAVVFTQPLVIADDGQAEPVELTHVIPE